MRYLLFLLFSATAFGQTYLANEYWGLSVPAGTTISVQYGCAAAWSAPITLVGPITSLQIYPGASSLLKGITDSGCSQRTLQAIQGATAATVTVYNESVSPVVATQVTIPVAGTPVPPVVPPVPPITFPLPTSGSKTCTLTWLVGVPVAPATVGPLTFTFNCP